MRSKVLRAGLGIEGGENNEKLGQLEDQEFSYNEKNENNLEILENNENFAVSWWKKVSKDVRGQRLENRNKLWVVQNVLEKVENIVRKDKGILDLKEVAAVWIEFLMGGAKENALRRLIRVLDKVEQDSVSSALLVLVKVWGDWVESDEVFEVLHNIWKKFEWTHGKILILITHLSPIQVSTFSKSLLFLDILDYTSLLPTEIETWLSVLHHLLPLLPKPSLPLLAYKCTISKLHSLASAANQFTSTSSCLSIINFLTH